MSTTPKKKKQMVTISNELNQIHLVGFSSVDQDILMALCLKAKNNGTSIIEMPLTELRDLTNYPKKSGLKKFAEKVDAITDKLLVCRIVQKNITQDNYSFRKASVFNSFELDVKNNFFSYSVAPEWSYLLNNLESNFTIFDLIKLTSLRGKHAKTLYRMLCQYRKKKGTSWWICYIEDTDAATIGIRSLFDIPTHQKDRKGNLKKDDNGNLIPYENKYILPKYIKPAIKELLEFKIFKTLTCEPITANTIGNPVIGYKFTYTIFENNLIPEAEEPSETSDNNIIINENQLYEKLLHICQELSEKNIQALVKAAVCYNRTEEYVLNALEKARNCDYSNLTALTTHFIKNGWEEPSFRNTKHEKGVLTRTDYDIDELEKKILSKKAGTSL